MENSDDNLVELKRYYTKLAKLIEEYPGLSLGGTKVIDKQKVDNILVCIEASFPTMYKKYLEMYGGKNLKCKHYHNLLMKAIKNKFLFSTSKYAVNVNEALVYINKIKFGLEPDFNYIKKNCPNL